MPKWQAGAGATAKTAVLTLGVEPSLSEFIRFATITTPFPLGIS